MKPLYLAITFLILSFGAYAQESCKENLYKANVLYEQGQLEEAIKMAKSCTNSEIEGERFQAWHLLAMAYLAQGEKVEARKCAENMLEIQPTYVPSKIKDPAELIRLLNSVSVLPKFSLGLAATIGINRTIPHVERTYNGADYSKEYSSQGGFQSGLIFAYHMNKIISLHSGFLFTRKAYEIDYSLEGNDFKVSERINYINLPAFARFSLPLRNNFYGYAEAGIFTGRLVASTSDFARTNIESGQSVEVNKLNSTYRRSKWEHGSIFGLGVMWRLKKGEITLDGKYYRAAFYNTTNTNQRYQTEDLFYQFYYLDDDFTLDNLVISLGFAYNLNYRILKSQDQ